MLWIRLNCGAGNKSIRLYIQTYTDVSYSLGHVKFNQYSKIYNRIGENIYTPVYVPIILISYIDGSFTDRNQ